MSRRGEQRGGRIRRGNGLLTGLAFLAGALAVWKRIPLTNRIGDNGNAYFGMAYDTWLFLSVLWLLHADGGGADDGGKVCEGQVPEHAPGLECGAFVCGGSGDCGKCGYAAFCRRFVSRAFSDRYGGGSDPLYGSGCPHHFPSGRSSRLFSGDGKHDSNRFFQVCGGACRIPSYVYPRIGYDGTREKSGRFCFSRIMSRRSGLRARHSLFCSEA